MSGPTEPVKLTALLPALELEAKFLLDFKPYSLCFELSRLYLGSVLRLCPFREYLSDLGLTPFWNQTVPVVTVPAWNCVNFGLPPFQNWAVPTGTVLAFGLIPFEPGVPAETAVQEFFFFYSREKPLRNKIPSH